jgi:CBS-domain-containing membrane protein
MPMRAKDVMSSPVVTVRSGSPAKAAARLLVEKGFTALPVVDGDDRLLGIVTEADLLRNRFLPDPRLLIHDDVPEPSDPPASTIDEVMVADVVTAATDAHTAAVSRLMVDRHLRAIPIVDDGRVVGIVTRRDLLRTIARDDEAIAGDVRHHPAAAGRRRWEISVLDGVVTLRGDGADSTESHVATVIAGAQPGVVDVHVVDERA